MVLTKISFPLSFADIRAHVEMQRRDGTWVYPELVDARDIGRIDFGPRDMLGIAHFVRGHSDLLEVMWVGWHGIRRCQRKS